jgi:cytidylate kinase
MPGITISAGFGAGGSVVAPDVAKRLGLPLLDRAISVAVAEQLHVSVPEAEGAVLKRSLVDRFFQSLAPLSAGVLGAGTDSAPIDILVSDDAEMFRQQAESIIRPAMAAGCVLLGRAGSAAFFDEPGVLRVRLFGPVEARIKQGSRVRGVDEATARKQLPEVDHARAHYVRNLYSADIDDPGLYHLQVDSTAISLSACAELIVAAYRGLAASS